MQQFGIFMLVAWIPITVGFFTAMSPIKAATTSLVAGWLILPPITLALPGIPDYSKFTAATFGILISTLIFELPRLLSLRPQWFDIPIFISCTCPFVSEITNGDTAYDGISLCLPQIFNWGLPYLIGRMYFGSLEGLQALALGVIAGGIAYLPPCLWEIRMSPQLLQQVYGTGAWIGMRLGGYRPRVFLSNGLELGIWMSAASLAAWWIWRSGSLKEMFGLPFGRILLPSLLITNILCRSSGALALCAMGMVTLWASVRFKTKGVLLCVILLTPLYYTVRVNKIWSGEGLVDTLGTYFDAERAWSVEFRFRNENLLVERALQRPIFGWGGFGRALEIDPKKLQEAGVASKVIPDGLWIIALGNMGLVGLVSLTLIALLPPLLFLYRFSPNEWLNPLVAPSAMFAVLLSIFMIDCLLNAMVNLIYVVAMGGLSVAIPSRNRHDFHQSTLSSTDTISADVSSSIEPEADLRRSSSENLANRYADLGRSLANQGRWTEARSTWFQALDLWNLLTSSHSENHHYLASWCECCNDLAWFLIDQPDPDARDTSQAVSLALKATETFPDRSDFWNTLGAAYYRAGDAQSAIDALHQSLVLQQNQGTAYDYFYLSLACSRLEQHDIARSWYDQGVAWIERNALDRPALHRLGHEAKENLTHYEQSEAGS